MKGERPKKNSTCSHHVVDRCSNSILRLSFFRLFSIQTVDKIKRVFYTKTSFAQNWSFVKWYRQFRTCRFSSSFATLLLGRISKLRSNL